LYISYKKDSWNMVAFSVGGDGRTGVNTWGAQDTFSIGDGDGDVYLNISSYGDIRGNVQTLNGSSTTNGTGASSTTMVLTSAANFDIGNYIQLASTNCVASVNTCYAKITNIVSSTLTISPALTWANASTVTE